ncbi:hypothetical protein PtrM4_121870 [Pyrenophora tritici-repentis]|uniref:Uncharacterized protein n=1 Tax=Pyrenophora tritici-repentis TaxID=45151 RepID=A0A834RUB4_9PLEO|nr:hypothetical protein A1F99_088490 [Pyrenophora tritici-repentis]KAF7569772.1 hypothetical protein PtrM4_121870 [Pyrenophora tritici-repentis]
MLASSSGNSSTVTVSSGELDKCEDERQHRFKFWSSKTFCSRLGALFPLLTYDMVVDVGAFPGYCVFKGMEYFFSGFWDVCLQVGDSRNLESRIDYIT